MTTDERLDRIEDAVSSLFVVAGGPDPDRYPNVDARVQFHSKRLKQIVTELQDEREKNDGQEEAR